MPSADFSSDDFPSATAPQFGEKRTGIEYIPRPGAYAIILDDAGRIAVVQCGEGWFLPGGGIDRGESPTIALSRECREECGRDAKVIGRIGQAIQYVVTTSGKYYAKWCSYFEARFVAGSECAPTETDHTLHWLAPADCLNRLTLEADRWALNQFAIAGE